MPDIPDGESESLADSGGWGRIRRKWNGRWSHLPKDKREQFEAIEARVRDKVERGEL